MKSVSLSQVVPTQSAHGSDSPVRSWRDVARLALTLSAGLALITLCMLQLAPSTPAAWIVVPVLLGGTLPLFAALPGQFDVTTRFDATYFVKTLDRSLSDMGYQPVASADPRRRSYHRRASVLRWKASTISLAVHEHAITVGGPLPALRQLQQQLAT